jgi:hypothetical protein
MSEGSAALVFMYNAQGAFDRIGFENDSTVHEAEEELLNNVLQARYL